MTLHDSSWIVSLTGNFPLELREIIIQRGHSSKRSHTIGQIQGHCMAYHHLIGFEFAEFYVFSVKLFNV